MASQFWYKYTALDEGSIRLLELVPGEDMLDLRCLIITTRLQDAPPYEALSYVWGNADPPFHLDCHSGHVRITTNLAAALDQVRSKDQKRFLWADQVCINQSDVDERSAQVNIMGSIFSRADRVIMWMGPDDWFEPQAPVAAKLMRKIASLEAPISFYGYQTPDDDDLARYNLPAQTSPEWEALDSFALLPYFQRVWIVQEIRLAARRSVLWGGTEFEWEVVRKTFLTMSERSNRAMRYRPQYDESRQSLINPAIQMINAVSEDHGSALNFIVLLHGRKAADDRDKVFAILGMLESIPASLHADYSKSLPEVYRSAVQVFLNDREASLEFLSFAGTPSRGQEPRETGPQWPSWVPQWHKVILPQIARNPYFRADCNERSTLCQIQPQNPTYLRVEGILVAPAAHISKHQEPVEQWDKKRYFVPDLVVRLTEAWELCLDHSKPPITQQGALMIDSLLQAFVCGTYETSQDSDGSRKTHNFLYDLPPFWAMRVLDQLRLDPRCTFLGLKRWLHIALVVLVRLTPAFDKSASTQPGNAAFDRAVQAAVKEFWEGPEAHGNRDELLLRLGWLKYFLADIFPDRGEHGAAFGLLATLLSVGDDTARFLDNYVVSSYRRRFFITSQGTVGMGPNDAQIGDIVVILFGARVPIVLRPTEIPRHYIILGECYLEGAMHGEYIEMLRGEGALERSKEIFHLV